MRRVTTLAAVWLMTSTFAFAQIPIAFEDRFDAATQAAPRGIVAADFDLDGHVDFAAAGLNQPSHDVVVWFGNGAGAFGRETVIRYSSCFAVLETHTSAIRTQPAARLGT